MDRFSRRPFLESSMPLDGMPAPKGARKALVHGTPWFEPAAG